MTDIRSFFHKPTVASRLKLADTPASSLPSSSASKPSTSATATTAASLSTKKRKDDLSHQSSAAKKKHKVETHEEKESNQPISIEREKQKEKEPTQKGRTKEELKQKETPKKKEKEKDNEATTSSASSSKTQTKRVKGTKQVIEYTPSSTPMTVDVNAYDEQPSETKPKPKFDWAKARAIRDTRNAPPHAGMKEIPEGKTNCLNGYRFVITGTLDTIGRDDAINLIKRYGGVCTTAISGKTTHLLLGEEPGESKVNEATKRNLPILSEDDLLHLIGTLPEQKGATGDTSSKTPSSSTLAKKKKETDAAQKAADSILQQPQKIESISPPFTTNQQPSAPPRMIVKQAPSSSSSTAAPTPSFETLLWVDKHKPKHIPDIVGNPTFIKSISTYLDDFEHLWRNDLHKADRNQYSFKALLIAGPPGIGKTTAATIVAKDKGYDVIEKNASDVRNKTSLQDVVSHLLGNRGLSEFYNTPSSSQPQSPSRILLIMDEVDGISGNEDRGGLQTLLQLIKKTRTPIICIANDISSPKMRSLRDKCKVLQWKKPLPEHILPRLLAICSVENLKIDEITLRKVYEMSHGDIRQTLNFLQMHRKGKLSLHLDEASTKLTFSKKDEEIDLFNAIPEFFKASPSSSSISIDGIQPQQKQHQNKWIDERSDYYFVDSGLIPLFVQENYLRAKPRLDTSLKRNLKFPLDVQGMLIVSDASDFISCSDLLDASIREEQEFSLMPTVAVLSCVAPGYFMSQQGLIGGSNFPLWLGQNSSKNKRIRLLNEMHLGMSLNDRSSVRSLITETIPLLLRAILLERIVVNGSAVVNEIVEECENLGMNRDDLNFVAEVTDPLAPPKLQLAKQLESTVKAAITRKFNVLDAQRPIKVYRYGTKAAGGITKRGGTRITVDELEEDADTVLGEDEEEVEEGEPGEEETLQSDKLIVRGAAKRGGRGSRGGRSSTSSRTTKGSTSKVENAQVTKPSSKSVSKKPATSKPAKRRRKIIEDDDEDFVVSDDSDF